jgi:Na+-transporting NADH:ubiquinone oxidoreductase subunit D
VSAKAKRLFLQNLGKGNPVVAQVLGICSTLAVTNILKNTVVMCLGVIFTLACANLTISLLRKWIPQSVRMIIEVLIIATYVIIVDLVIQAKAPEISRTLGPYVGLIITNCIIMGRAEAFALINPPHPTQLDGISSGIGYSYVLLTIAFFRELLGSGSIWGLPVLGDWWVNWSIMVMAPGGFFMLAIFIWIIKRWVVTEEA